MPRYFFNVVDGVAMEDMEGIVLPDFPAARLEAIRRAGEILQNNALSVALGDDWRIEVREERGIILFVMTFLVHEAPAVLRSDHIRRSS